MQPRQDEPALPWAPRPAPLPVPELDHPWRAVIMLDHTPICPICADALTPCDIDTIKGVACCQLCTTRARATNWPEPYDFSHLFDLRDLMFACGLHWYHPRDGSQETAFTRHERQEAHIIEAADFKKSRLN